MSANDIQVGGGHYRTEIQHWDFVAANRMGYFEGQATKYITRWRKKNGVEDLRKARHYVDKLIELLENNGQPLVNGSLRAFQKIATTEFADANNLQPVEVALVYILNNWNCDGQNDPAALRTVRYILEEMINQEVAAEPGPGYVNQGDK